jgi:hypothetical protein
LVPATGNDVSGVKKAFRLQSQDDIVDAPIAIAACQLLQTANSTVKRFYRQRIGIDVQGRVAVLKETLRQIGDANAAFFSQ